MKSKATSIEMTSLQLQRPSSATDVERNGKSSSNNSENNLPELGKMNGKSSSVQEVNRVSDWYDTDGYKKFMRTVRDGDILELRNNRTSHWGIATRLKQSASPNGKQLPDEFMIYHLVHSPTHRGQVGQFTIEEFWTSDSRIRINNTTNGMSLYGNPHPISRTDVLKNAFTAHMSTTLKWQTCSDFIRWSCEDNHDLHSHHSSKSMSKSSSSAEIKS